MTADAKLPHDWPMPQTVEDLFPLLNSHGGRCFKEHADLLRAFFERGRYVSSEELAALRKDRESLNGMATLLAAARRQRNTAWKMIALLKGWKQPQANDPFDLDTWVRYWQDCAAYDADPSMGRAVVPHRSGGGDVPPTISHGD